MVMKQDITARKELFQKEQQIKEYKIKLEENKKKKEQYFNDNEKRKITEKEFEKHMIVYNLEEYELELEIKILEKEIFVPKAVYKRLNYLYLLLSFCDGVEAMVLKDAQGKKKRLYQKDVCKMFIDLVLEETKSTLEQEQKIRQLYMLLNTSHHHFLDKEHKFYLDEEKQKEVYVDILEKREKVKEVENNSKINKGNDEDLFVEDFFTTDILSVYERLFQKQNLERKITNN